MFKVGDVVRIIENEPWRSGLRKGDLAVLVSVDLARPVGGEVSHNGETWWIDPTPGIHAELVQSAPAAPVKISRDKAEQLCRTYELYRKAHDHATAFELAYGIEIEGLPF